MHVAKDYAEWTANPNPRIKTGISFWDEPMNGGIGLSQVAFLTAYSNVGKTAIALGIILNNPEICTVFFSLEMPGKDVLGRMAAIHTGLPSKEIEMYSREMKQPHQAIYDTADYYTNIWMNDMPYQSMKDMRAQLSDLVESGIKPELVVIDYMELIKSNSALSSLEQVDRVSRDLKQMAKEFNVALLVLHQVNRSDGSDKPLSLQSGRYGGEVAADYVLSAYRPNTRQGISQGDYEREKSDIFLQLLKSRAGMLHPSGERHVMDPQNMRLTAVKKEFSYESSLPDFIQGVGAPYDF